MQFETNNYRIHPMSNSLIFHCHGGAYVALTSKSHEVYLRGWAAELQVPIVSVDHSLAPQAPYPRALEEAFYAYCWAIKNANLLGTTAERIVVVGDSDGGTLNMALTLKCIDQKVRRPDGVLLIYTPLIIGFQPFPSRLLAMMDVLSSFGFLMRAVKAYVHVDEDTKDRESATYSKTDLLTDHNLANDFQFDVPSDPFISPIFASDKMLKQMPPIKFVVSFPR